MLVNYTETIMPDKIEPETDHDFTYTVPESKTIPGLFPESEYFQQMPEVLATGYLVGLIEWACIEMLEPSLDWPQEQSVGVHMDVRHEAPTPPETEVTIHVEVTEVDGRKLTFEVEARDEVERIGRGTHQRFIVDRDGFVESIDNEKR